MHNAEVSAGLNKSIVILNPQQSTESNEKVSVSRKSACSFCAFTSGLWGPLLTLLVFEKDNFSIHRSNFISLQIECVLQSLDVKETVSSADFDSLFLRNRMQ